MPMLYYVWIFLYFSYDEESYKYRSTFFTVGRLPHNSKKCAEHTLFQCCKGILYLSSSNTALAFCTYNNKDFAQSSAW